MPNPNEQISPSMQVQNAAQAAAQNAATQAAQAAQDSTMTQSGGLGSAQPMGTTDGTAQMSANAMPAEVPGVETPTAANGQLFDDVSHPENNPEGMASKVQNFSDARNALAALLNGANNTPKVEEVPAPNINPILQMEQGTPNPMPNLNNVDGLVAVDVQAPNGIPQEPGVTRSDLDDIKNLIQNALGNRQPESQPVPPVATEPVPEPESEPILDINSDEFYEMFSEDPGKAISEVANQIAAQRVKASEDRMNELTNRLQPLLQESERMEQKNRSMDAMRQFLQKGNGQYDDFKDMIPDIAKIVKDEGMGFEDPRSFEFAYNKAKTNRLSQQLAEAQNAVNAARQQSSLTLGDYLNDDNSINQIAHNDRVKSQVINEYLQGLRDGANPAQITSGSGSFVANPAKRATNLKEASNRLADMLNNR